MKLKEIINEVKQQMKDDECTELIIRDFKLTDCNSNVSQASICLREYLIYSNNESEEDKDTIQALLIGYGYMFDGDYSHLDQCKDIILQLLGDEYIQKIICAQEIGFNDLEIIEKSIENILLKFYKPYTIPKDKYNTIIFSHRNQSTDACATLKHHYKCLHNPSLDWNLKQTNYQFEFDVTYKDIKAIILHARDSGGHLDCFGYAHDGTTGNCIRAFLGNKFNIPYECGYPIDNEELEMVAEDLYDIVKYYVDDFYVSIY